LRIGQARRIIPAQTLIPDDIAMYYDDEARRFNFASGLVLGAILGTGLALLAAPQKRPSRVLRKVTKSLQRGSRGFDPARRIARSGERALSALRKGGLKF
jgi:hypothetical protein